MFGCSCRNIKSVLKMIPLRRFRYTLKRSTSGFDGRCMAEHGVDGRCRTLWSSVDS